MCSGLAPDDLSGQQELERLGKAGLALAVGRPDGGKRRAKGKRLSLPAERPEALNLNLVDLRCRHAFASVHRDGLQRPSPRHRRPMPRLARRRRHKLRGEAVLGEMDDQPVEIGLRRGGVSAPRPVRRIIVIVFRARFLVFSAHAVAFLGRVRWPPPVESELRFFLVRRITANASLLAEQGARRTAPQYARTGSAVDPRVVGQFEISPLR